MQMDCANHTDLLNLLLQKRDKAGTRMIVYCRYTMEESGEQSTVVFA
jgi:hypothetical protein